MTAEGDNRVLMQKIVKDILADMQKGVYRAPKMTKCPKRELPAQESVGDIDSLVNLVYYKEVAETKAMAGVLQQKLMTEGKKFYDVWMHEVSDQIQALAVAYGERFSLEAGMECLAKLSGKPKDVLAKLIRLHCLALVRENLGWYLLQGVVSHKAGTALEAQYQ
jgi:acyl-CoA oxidase